MRIASISKPITCAISAKLFELKKLDLDKSVNDYLNNLPVFNWNDKNVVITARQLMSHTSGIRHYEKNVNLNESNEKNQSNNSDTNYKEFYIKDHFDKTSDALSIFINDKLLFEPSNKLI
jgi:serine beta-lactamase-like protein LACTB